MDEELDDEIAEIVRKYGWYAAGVNDYEPPFLYSIGLMLTWNHPELIVFGLPPDDSYALFCGVIQSIRAGATYTQPGVQSVSIGGVDHRVGFRAVHPTQHPLYLGFAMGFCRTIDRWGELEAVQMYWPDVNGLFPFEVGCDVDVYRLQPRLDIPLTPTEIREFERRWE